MSKIAGIIFSFSLFFLGSCSNEDSKKSKPIPLNLVEDEQKQQLSSCTYCGGGGYGGRPEVCKNGESCIGTTVNAGGAPVTVASCYKTFKDTNGQSHSYACAKK